MRPVIYLCFVKDVKKQSEDVLMCGIKRCENVSMSLMAKNTYNDDILIIID